MTSKATPAATQNAPDAQLIFDLATGFMRAKHLFAASELGVFEALGERAATLDALAARLKIPRRTTRIVADAVTALGLLERHGDTNTATANWPKHT
jgi:methyltransferase family protein